MKPIQKLSRRHLINSFDVWLTCGLTVWNFYSHLYLCKKYFKEDDNSGFLPSQKKKGENKKHIL